MLEISNQLLDQITNHGKKTYPDESCGIMAGYFENDKRIVKKVYESENLNKERSKDRYELNQKDFLMADRDSENLGMEIVGIYHSHPDHPSKASETDRQKAHQGYSYLITAIHQAEYFSRNSWVLDSDSQFIEEEIIIKE